MRPCLIWIHRNWYSNVVLTIMLTLILKSTYVWQELRWSWINGDYCRHSIKTWKNWSSIHVHSSILIIILSIGRNTFYIKNIYRSSTCTCILWWISLWYLDWKRPNWRDEKQNFYCNIRERRFLKLLFELEAFAGSGGLSFSRAWAKKCRSRLSIVIGAWHVFKTRLLNVEIFALTYGLDPNVEEIAHMQKP